MKLDASQRRESLLDAGWYLLTNHGPAAITIEAVVERDGISRPIFYRHFSDRNDFLAALYDRHADQLHARQSSILAASGDFRSFVRRSLADYLDMVDATGLQVRALVHEAGGDERMEQARARLRADQLELLTSALASDQTGDFTDLLDDGTLRPIAVVTLELLQSTAAEAATSLVSGRYDRTELVVALELLIDATLDRLGFAARSAPVPGAD